MSPDRAVLERAIERGEREGGSVEFKERLTKDLHLADGRRESLAAQLRHRVLSGDGEATYVVGVTDDGGIAGIAPDEFTESMDVLSLLAEEADAHIENVETWGADAAGNAKLKDSGARSESAARSDPDAPEQGIVGVAIIREGAVLEDDEHIVVGTAGHVDHGKSTLVGSLVTGQPDDGEGGTRSYLDVQPHEVERGLSADLSYGVYGFDDDGPVRMDNPDRKSDRARVVEEADRLVSFVDTVGHEPWLRTTIRGLVGQKLDYGMLAVAADDGPTKTTREHLGILLATDLPTMVVITKADIVSEERLDEVEREVERQLREVGKTPLSVDRHGVAAAVEEIDDTVVPVLATSAVTMEGMDDLDEILERLPKTAGPEDDEFTMYVDRSYKVTGVGAVASGTIRSGQVEAGDELLLGPMQDGSFREVEVRSIEMHYHRVDQAQAGRIVGIALKGSARPTSSAGWSYSPRCRPRSRPRVRGRGDGPQPPDPHRRRVRTGRPPRNRQRGGRLLPRRGASPPGDSGTARVRFKFRPYMVEEGQRFVFREGQSKGVGKVTAVDVGD
ncbi:GTPBP1 family GTP-binding protein [Halosimplex aquaticum]